MPVTGTAHPGTGGAPAQVMRTLRNGCIGRRDALENQGAIGRQDACTIGVQADVGPKHGCCAACSSNIYPTRDVPRGVRALASSASRRSISRWKRSHNQYRQSAVLNDRLANRAQVAAHDAGPLVRSDADHVCADASRSLDDCPRKITTSDNLGVRHDALLRCPLRRERSDPCQELGICGGGILAPLVLPYDVDQMHLSAAISSDRIRLLGDVVR
jgi:hypothetical protein